MLTIQNKKLHCENGVTVTSFYCSRTQLQKAHAVKHNAVFTLLGNVSEKPADQMNAISTVESSC